MGYAYFNIKDYNMGIQYIEKAIHLSPDLGIEVSSDIKEFKNLIDKLEFNLSEKFINR